MDKHSFFSSLHDELITRSSRSITSLLGVANTPLRKFLVNTLKQPGTLLADPVFEPTFGWTECKDVMRELPASLVHPRLLQAMSNPPKGLAKEYTFPLDRHPFEHQLVAWNALSDSKPQSLVVTSGTGSGKTECFLVPILNRLAHQVEADKGCLEGIRALFIYPLNALISSQKNRLDAWTDGFDGDIRYCLYTGNLDETAKAATRQYKGEVLDRKSLRASAPPLLITNATMLEYMLVRKEDKPILEKSQGKLEWIVLDEAHTYIGSQAAEMAMLLRRVMIAFAVKPENVRFVATSATFGADEETTNQLKEFLAHMAGVSPEQVSVVHGKRHVPTLAYQPAGRQISLENLWAIDSENECSDARFRALCESPIAVSLRSAFLADDGSCRPRKLSQLSAAIGGSDQQTTLRWLDLLTGTRNSNDQPFVPLRTHVFHNVFSHLGACVNPECSQKHGLDDGEQKWPFGMVYFDDQDKCQCGAPILPIAQCQECREPGLLGIQSSDFKLEPKERDSDDEFSLDQDLVDQDDEENNSTSAKSDLLIVNQQKTSSLVDTAWLDLDSHKLSDRPVAERNGVDLALVHLVDGEQSCPCCGSRFKYRKMSVGTPFVLSTTISTLLEYCPDDFEQPATKPARGRKMISFTDSRQGTARIAVKLQQDSERAKVRGLIYHNLLSSRKANTLSDQEIDDLEELLAEQKMGSLRPRDLNYLNTLLEKRGDGGHAPLSWDALKNCLAADRTISQNIFDYYRRFAPNSLPDGIGQSRLAEIFLFREFSRRPKTQNSLESMGFVALHYPQLKMVTTTPMGWPSDIAAWRDYLKVLLDFFIRENSFIEIPKDYLSLVGMKLAPKWLRPPTSNEENSSRIKKWPQYILGSSNPRLQSRPIVLLQNAFDWQGDECRERIDLILCEAWKTLVDIRLLKPSEDGYRLHLSDVEFSLIGKAGVCPITRRFLDTCFSGYSPYTFPSNRKELHQCRLVQEMPVYLHAFGGGADADRALDIARHWLSQNEVVAKLREDGLWSDLHDRVVEGGVFYRAAEHSAQQPQSLLQSFERDFKQGKLNLMSCSTTMEMGVDIGGITVVAMNNVPPHPANYLQRAGRAGRRRESRAIAATVCKNTPHDQSVFKNPLWAFEKKIPMPIVSLQSPDLVQRHINAHLLSSWMKHVMKEDELRKTTCGSFFLPSVGEHSIADRFIMWCKNSLKNIESDPEIRNQFSALLRHTPYEGARVERLVELCGEAMAAVAAEWLKVFDGIQQQLDAFGSEETPARKAMSIQLSRVQGEYLLSEIATRRFLPGYGFPTDIVCFDNNCISTLKLDDSGAKKEREDNRMRSKSLASRDRATALREYAPGAEIVMNGLVYRSGGITLNWHVPASEDQMKEAQLFKTAWRCKACGASGSAIGNTPEICECCGSELGTSRDERMSYLVPSGFAVDFFAEPHTDVSAPTYIPVKQPWLSLSESWCTLVNPALGVFRTSSKAHLYHYTGGHSDSGFAICLECGRAEPMRSNADPHADESEQFLPEAFRKGKTHFRLRGGKGKEGKSICPGSDDVWKVKQNVFLGHDSETDAFEVLLRDPETHKWLADDVVAYTLAVAIRSVLAQELGILEEELGCASREIRHDNQVVRAIQVFDLRSGGYSSLAHCHVNKRSFWEDVCKKLECAHGCAAACQYCLQSFDNRFAAERLNRIDAQAWLNEKWLNQFALPEAMQAFGCNSIVESDEILVAISRESSSPPSCLRLYLHGHPKDWAIPSAVWLRWVVKKSLANGIAVEFIAANASLEKMDIASRYVLASMIDFGAVYVEVEICAMRAPNDSLLIASVSGAKNIAWSFGGKDLIMLPDSSWGNTPEGSLIVFGDFVSTAVGGIDVELIRPRGGDVRVEISKELDGSSQGFGEQFWVLLMSKSDKLKSALNQDGDPLIVMRYSDRYMNNPVSLKLFVETVCFLKKLPCGDNQYPEVLMNGRKFFRDGERKPIFIWHDWLSSDDRNSVLIEALDYCGFTPSVNDKYDIQHGRVLELEFESGKKFVVQLDQGFSFWRADENHARSRWFFDCEYKDQAEYLIKEGFDVVRDFRADVTQIFVASIDN